MGWISDLFGESRLATVCEYALERPEATLALAAILFLLLRGSFRTALILAFGAVLCWANYYVFAQKIIFTMPLGYAVVFAAISVVALILVVYQLIQSA